MVINRKTQIAAAMVLGLTASMAFAGPPEGTGGGNSDRGSERSSAKSENGTAASARGSEISERARAEDKPENFGQWVCNLVGGNCGGETEEEEPTTEAETETSE